MSYCRWSCDNYKSDLYCYEDVNGGWTTHVAASRYVGELPTSPYSLVALDVASTDPDGFKRLKKEFHAAIEAIEKVDIGLAHDGQSFNDDSLEDFLERVRGLKEMGYYVPDHVIPDIEAEIREGTSD